MSNDAWLPSVRRVRHPGMRRNEYDIEVDRALVYNPGSRSFRRNPEVTGTLCEAPTGATYRIGVIVPHGRFALDGRDEAFVVRLGLRPRDQVQVTYYPEDQFATILRPQTLVMHERCSGCWSPPGRCQCDEREVRPNPTLQILGDYAPPRTNPGTAAVDLGGSDAVDRGTAGAIRKFHGKVTGDVVSQYDSGDGEEDVIDLAYLGHVPAVAWISDEPGSAKKQIDVDGELVGFRGFRRLFRGQSRPILALHVPSNVAVVVQGTVESLRDRCDSNGVLGFSPVVEYIVDAVKGSSKGSYHYVHEFAKDYEPVLRWSDSMSGLVYDRDRSLIGPESSGRSSNPRFNKTAVYEVADWFREKGFEGHH